MVVRGEIDDLVAPAKATFSLNGSPPRPFYVEDLPDDGTDWVNSYKKTPAELRCKELGEFCIEIPINDAALREGRNRLSVKTEDAAGHRHLADIEFDWDPRPVPLPLDLRDLSGYSHVQHIGQALNGVFDLDTDQNVIRSRAPVAPDAFLILGSPHESQEATYAVRFLELAGAKWLGLSDFMAGQQEGNPPRGIKVGWSSAGMAALSPSDGARAFIAWGDHSAQPEEWAIATNPAVPFRPQKRKVYRVRHQIRFVAGIDQVRFRIWPADQAEPDAWLCDEQDDAVPEHLPRHQRASFGLFQHLGLPIEWSDILVKSLDPSVEPPPRRGSGRLPFLGRKRPGAF